MKVVRGKCGALTVQRGVNHCIIETSSSLDHNGQIKLVSMKGFGGLEIYLRGLDHRLGRILRNKTDTEY